MIARAGGGVTLLHERSADIPLVDVEIAVRAGSLRDPEGKDGLMRLLAGSLRKGSGRMRASEVEETVARLGGRLGAGVNSGTLRLQGTVIKRNLAPFFALLAGLVREPALRGADVAQLQRETLDELIAVRDDDRTLAARAFRRFLFAGHPYGRLTSGTAKTVRSIRRADLVAAHGEILFGENVVVGMAGDVEEEEVHALVASHLADLPRGRVHQVKVPAPRMPKGRRVLIVDKPDRTQTQLFIGTLGTRHRDPLLFPLMVADTAFGGTFTARLMHQVRSVRGWSYGAYSRLTPDRQRDAWYMWTFPAATDAAACAALQLELLDGWVGGDLSHREVQLAKKYLVNSHCFDVDTAGKRLDAALDVELLGIPEEHHRHFARLVRAVKRDDAREAVRRRISSRDLAIVVVASAKEVRGAFEALPGVTEVKVVPYDRDAI